MRAFRYAYQALETRIKLFTSLRLDALDRLAIKREVDEIGRLRIVPTGEPAP
jgi:arsenate reductase